MDDKNFNLVKLDSKLAEKIYNDVFSSSFQKAWNALWDVIGLVTSITLPIAMFNNFTNYILQKNIKKYEKKLNNITEEDRIKVSPEIWVPILDKLTYYENDKLSDMFLELLKKASNKNEVSKVHPKYIKIIENLSEDEALILNYFYTNKIERIPYLNLIVKNEKNSWIMVIKYFSELNNFNEIKNKENLITYIENLVSLWIFQTPDNTYIANEELYNTMKLDKFISKKQNIALNTYQNTEFNKIDFQKWKLELSWLWKWFLEAIFNNN